MTAFILGASLLTLLALAVLTRRLWRRGANADAEGAGEGAAALRLQLEQLASLHGSGVLGKPQYTQAREALERRIADAVVTLPARSAPPSRATLLGIAGFVTAVAAAGYAWLGAPQALNPEVASAVGAEGAAHTVTAEQIDGMLDKVRARLKDKPDDVEGWVMLGRSLAVLGRHEQAAPAFKRATELRPDDASLWADYADALAMANGRTLEGEPTRLVARALEVDPNNAKALSLAGTIAFNNKDFAGALRHWERLVQQAPESPLSQQIQGGIDEARKLLGSAAPSAAATPAPSAAAKPAQPTDAGGTSVSGTVTLSKALTAKAQPDDTLYVFARPAEGSRMPLAVLRKQVRDLPFTFTLDDSMAMSPAARLSSTPRVIVGARISKSGSAVPQPGDLQGLSAPVAPGTTQLKIEIAEQVGS